MTYVVVGVVVGLVLAQGLAAGAPGLFGSVGTGDSDGVVAVVPIQGMITGSSATEIQTALTQARADPDVEAVVLVANSGGGTAAASEEIYFAVKRAKASGLPVTATVDAVAASGAYYGVAPADEIFVKPASAVGSIGVIAQLPPEVEPNSIVGATGPNKLSGADTREFRAILESLQAAFVNAVVTQRGDELSLSRTDVQEARIYSGTQAVQNGLADSVGDREAAIQAAAERADLEDYRVRVYDTTPSTSQFVSRAAYLASDAEDKRMFSTDTLLRGQTGGPTFLMVGGAFLAGGEGSAAPAASGATNDSADGAAPSLGATDAAPAWTTPGPDATGGLGPPGSEADAVARPSASGPLGGAS